MLETCTNISPIAIGSIDLLFFFTLSPLVASEPWIFFVSKEAAAAAELRQRAQESEAPGVCWEDTATRLRLGVVG